MGDLEYQSAKDVKKQSDYERAMSSVDRPMTDRERIGVAARKVTGVVDKVKEAAFPIAKGIFESKGGEKRERVRVVYRAAKKQKSRVVYRKAKSEIHDPFSIGDPFGGSGRRSKMQDPTFMPGPLESGRRRKRDNFDDIF